MKRLTPAAVAAAIGILLIVAVAVGRHPFDAGDRGGQPTGHEAATPANVAGASCHIAGDSIAVGLHRVLRGCTWSAKSGIPSRAIIARVAPARFLVVSAGSNDPGNPRLAENLEEIRRQASAEVIWILPAVPRARAVVARMAAAHGDRTVTFIASRDHVHPRSYAGLARAVLIEMNRGPSS